jgi:hypothetical protein
MTAMHTHTTVRQMWEDDFVVFQYDLMSDDWIGRDLEGNSWSVSPDQFSSNTELFWIHFFCDENWYRCCKVATLKRCNCVMVPKKNISNDRG